MTEQENMQESKYMQTFRLSPLVLCKMWNRKQSSSQAKVRHRSSIVVVVEPLVVLLLWIHWSAHLNSDELCSCLALQGWGQVTRLGQYLCGDGWAARADSDCRTATGVAGLGRYARLWPGREGVPTRARSRRAGMGGEGHPGRTGGASVLKAARVGTRAATAATAA